MDFARAFAMVILNHLNDRFPGTDAITRADFRTFLNISHSTDCRLKKSGHYPRLINVAGSEKILLIDLAAWLEQGGAPSPTTLQERKGRGRPKGSRNKPKPPHTRTNSPALPPQMATALGIHAPQ